MLASEIPRCSKATEVNNSLLLFEEASRPLDYTSHWQLAPESGTSPPGGWEGNSQGKCLFYFETLSFFIHLFISYYYIETYIEKHVSIREYL